MEGSPGPGHEVVGARRGGHDAVALIDHLGELAWPPWALVKLWKDRIEQSLKHGTTGCYIYILYIYYIYICVCVCTWSKIVYVGLCRFLNGLHMLIWQMRDV